MDLAIIGGALGGIGLFLLGMRLMTEGLKVAAGELLKDILSTWTKTRIRGLASGVLITGLVQSSSAVTVASIGFVNAGVLSLGQAIWVIFGSNVGTTMTGWIVAVVGFDIKIEAFALPLLGIGMFLSLTGPSSRRGAIGEAIAGFGIFFLGIATLKATFAGLGAAVDIAAFAGGGILNDALFVAVGFVLTSLVQSSSAVIAIALTAAIGGVLTIESGASLVIGANVGTTTTALIAVLGATPNAKRVALSHVTFNVLTGGVALLALPLMLVIVGWVEGVVSGGADPAATLALFHTVFNVLGVLIIWPLAGRLEAWLTTRFVSLEEDLARPKFLDKTILEVPALALKAVLLELHRVAEISLGAARTAFTDPHASADALWHRQAAVERLNGAIIAYIQQFNAGKHSLPMAEALSHPIRALMHFADIVEHALAFVRARDRLAKLPPDQGDQIANYLTLVVGQMDAVFGVFDDPAQPPLDEAALEPVYQHAKATLLAAASTGALGARDAETALEALSDLRAVVKLLNRVEKRIAAIAKVERDSEDADAGA